MSDAPQRWETRRRIKRLLASRDWAGSPAQRSAARLAALPALAILGVCIWLGGWVEAVALLLAALRCVAALVEINTRKEGMVRARTVCFCPKCLLPTLYRFACARCGSPVSDRLARRLQEATPAGERNEHSGIPAGSVCEGCHAELADETLNGGVRLLCRRCGTCTMPILHAWRRYRMIGALMPEDFGVLLRLGAALSLPSADGTLCLDDGMHLNYIADLSSDPVDARLHPKALQRPLDHRDSVTATVGWYFKQALALETAQKCGDDSFEAGRRLGLELCRGPATHGALMAWTRGDAPALELCAAIDRWARASHRRPGDLTLLVELPEHECPAGAVLRTRLKSVEFGVAAADLIAAAASGRGAAPTLADDQV